MAVAPATSAARDTTLSGVALARFAVLSCRCGEVWAAETRHARVACPRCGDAADLSTRKRLWQGDDGAAARKATAQLRAQAAGAPALDLTPEARPARHDSPEDAAAAKAAGITNRSDRAEAVALWLTRLVGVPTHAQLVDALQRAGLDAPRAEREVVRMLAMDYLTEPRAGTYRVLDA